MITQPQFQLSTGARGPAVALALAGAVLLTSCASQAGHSAESAAPTVAVAEIHRVDLKRAVTLTAEFRPYEEVDVHAKVAGYVKEINVDVGARVKAGQLLATLEIPELKDEEAQADAAVGQSKSEINRWQSDLDRAQSAHDMAHSAASRLTAVSKSQPRLVSQQEIEDAQGRDRVAEAQVATAKAALESAKQQLNVAEANQAKAHALFEYARITAPFDGVVTKRYADTGSMIQAGTSSQTQAMPIIRLSRNERLRLVIPVPESAVPRVAIGSVVDVRVPVLNKTFPGVVARFSGQVDMTTRMMHTEVDVVNPTFELMPGMYAEATLVLNERPNVIAVPIQALNRSETRVTVLRVDAQHQLQEQTVTLGIESADSAEVLSGLAEGDLVVTGPRAQLRAGMAIQPKVVAAASGGR